MAEENVSRIEELRRLWDQKLAALKGNRRGRIPQNEDVEKTLVKEMEAIYLELPEEERETLEKPESPRYIRTSADLIALDDQGRLIGFEDLD